jgi:hypothetical protein
LIFMLVIALVAIVKGLGIVSIFGR